MFIANIIALILVIIGGINWGLIGLFRFNLVEAIFGESRIATRIIYCLVFLATIWLIISWIISGSIMLMA